MAAIIRRPRVDGEAGPSLVADYSGTISASLRRAAPYTASSMEAFICKTCGVQYDVSDSPPAQCLICEDERQYVGWQGQEWTTLAEMQALNYSNELREQEAGLVGIGTKPHFAIGHRALLVQTTNGNLLWDCVSYIDDQTVDEVRALGGVQAIAASHPHFYGSMVAWSLASERAPVYVPEADLPWLLRHDRADCTVIASSSPRASRRPSWWRACARSRARRSSGDLRALLSMGQRAAGSSPGRLALR